MTIAEVNTVLRKLAEKLAPKPTNKPAKTLAKRTSKLSSKPKLVSLTKPARKANNNTVTIRKSLRDLLK